MAYVIGGLIGFNIAAIIFLAVHIISAAVRTTVSATVALIGSVLMAIFWTCTAAGHSDTIESYLHVNHIALYGCQLGFLWFKCRHWAQLLRWRS